jgi:hypothetical protein
LQLRSFSKVEVYLQQVPKTISAPIFRPNQETAIIVEQKRTASARDKENAVYLNSYRPSFPAIAMYFHPQVQPFQPPINSLPFELLAYIFVLGTHEPINPPPEQQDDDCQPFDSESVKTPLVYASVSRHWREVALNTPALYTSLCITPELFREVGEKEVLDTTGISSYLALSRNYLVDILIDARDQQWNFEDDG